MSRTTNQPGFFLPTLFVVGMLAILGWAKSGETPSAVDPGTIKALETMGAYLRSLSSFEVEAETTTDEFLDNGQKVQITGTAQLKIRRPDGLRATLKTERKHREFYFDGKTLTISTPPLEYYAAMPAPKSVEELIAQLAEKYGIEVPLLDLFLWGSEPAGAPTVRSASRIGPSTVDGVVCEHYAFREPGVDWQLWIQNGDIPLPRKLVVTATDEPSQPAHVSVLKWNTTPAFDAGTFAFQPVGANRIVLQTSDAKIPPPRRWRLRRL